MNQDDLERKLLQEDVPLLNKSYSTLTPQEAEVRKAFNAHMIYLANMAMKISAWYSDDDYDYMEGALDLAQALLSADYDGNMEGLVATVNEGGPPWGESTTPEVRDWLYQLPGVTLGKDD